MIRRLLRSEAPTVLTILVSWAFAYAVTHLADTPLLPQPARLERGSAGRSYPVR